MVLSCFRFGSSRLVTTVRVAFLAAATPLAAVLVAADPPPPPTVPDDLDPHVVTTAAGVRIELAWEHPDVVTPM